MGNIIFMRTLNYANFLSDQQVPDLNNQFTSIVANVYSMANSLSVPVDDVIRGQALMDPILSTKVFVFYQKFPIDVYSPDDLLMPSYFDIAIIRKLVSEFITAIIIFPFLKIII